ncbi:thiamine pyrophosphate-dependent enzyme [Microlunatus lacustris]
MHPLDASTRRSLADLSEAAGAGTPAPSDNSVEWWEGVFDAQATSRHLDFVARELQAAGEGFYTIGSAGHEANALVAAALRPTDPALLHYRSGGFYAVRAAQVPGSTPVRDVLQGVMALAEEPIAGGRHKVFGHPDLAVIPQTSTIASHLPRAVGLALALHRAHRLGVDCRWPRDAVVVASFGDASANHSTLTGAVGSALNAAHRGLDVPLLLVCEDNGYGISVPTPAGWVEHAYGARPGLDYVGVDGADPLKAWPRIVEAAERVRRRRRPLFLHLRTVRFLGHAGSDAEVSYRTPRAIAADYARDPLLGTARLLLGLGRTPAQLLERYAAAREAVDAEAARLRGGRRLGSAAEVMAPLAPRRPERVAQAVRTYGPSAGPRSGATLAESINATLAQLLEADRRVLVFGEDVGVKGGVYGVTGGLARRFGAARVFDTVLDEQSVLGMALGAGLAGLVPVPEIQYLAYLHNAEDQLRGEAATLGFFSNGAHRNPLVVRVAGLAYQRGFGGHFHNDHALGVLRDIPGLVLACPSRGDDAAAMLRTCVAAAATDGTVAVFLEPIALYHRRDLHEPGDGGWLSGDDAGHVPVGRARLHAGGAPDVADLTLVTFGNGVPMSLRVARRLAGQGVRAAVLDLRWLAPLPVADLLAAASASGRVLVVDETRHTGGVGEGVVTALVEHGFRGAIARVASADSFVPLGPAAAHVLLAEDEIELAALTLVARETPSTSTTTTRGRT